MAVVVALGPLVALVLLLQPPDPVVMVVTLTQALQVVLAAQPTQTGQPEQTAAVVAAAVEVLRLALQQERELLVDRVANML